MLGSVAISQVLMKYSVNAHLSVLLTTVILSPCLDLCELWLTVVAAVKNLTSQGTLMLLMTHCKYKQANKLNILGQLPRLHTNAGGLSVFFSLI